MNITKQIAIEAPVDAAWERLGPQFSSVDRWASSVARSRLRDDGRKLAGAPCYGRVCETDLGPFRESLVEYDERSHVLAYEASGDKMPFFVKKLRNRWSLHAQGPETTLVQMEMNVDLMPVFSLLMGPMMRRQMAPVMAQSIEEFKHFVETGRPHPRKEQAIAEAAAA